MGVLKVNVGDAVTPDWRKIGCGKAETAFTLEDDFNRSDRNLSGDNGWTGTSAADWTITSNTARLNALAGANGDSYVTLRRDAPSDDMHDVQATLTSSASGAAALVWRWVSDSDLFYVRLDGASGNVALRRWSGGVRTTIGSYAATGGSHVVRVIHDFVGGQVQVLVDGVVQIAETQAVGVSAGAKVGLAAFAVGDLADDFTVGSATTGRLKLWDGTQWVREACDDDLGSTLADTFSRSDSATDVNPASDGGVWTVDAGTWGISSNQGYLASLSGGAGSRTGFGFVTMSTDHGTTAVDVTVRNFRANKAGFSALIFATSAAETSEALSLVFDSDLLNVYHSTVHPHTDTNLGSVPRTVWTAGSTLLRVVYDPTTGALDVYQDGALKLSTVLAVGYRVSGSVVALGSQVTTAGEFWDDFTVAGSSVGAVSRHPLKVWDGTAWVTVACMVPA